MRERTRRIVPQKAITVAIEGARSGRSYGVIANISEGGACVLTDARIPLGQSLSLELSFFREPQVVAAAGHVIWTSGNRDSGALRYGLEWAPGSGDERLKDLIERAAE
jgi:Tfp pilus assembly protein PilZ